MSSIFKPTFFNTARVSDNSTISNGQFIVDVQTHKVYVDYNNQRLLLSPFPENNGQLKEFAFGSSTTGVTVNQNGSFDAVFSKTQLDVSSECPVQLFDGSGYEIGSGLDIIIRWNHTTGNLEIHSENSISGTWTLKLYDESQYQDFQFSSSTEGYVASQTSGFTATFSKSQLNCGSSEPMFQLFDNNGYEIGSGSDISMRWNPTTGNLEIQSITNISGTWTIKFSIGGIPQEDDTIRLLTRNIVSTNTTALPWNWYLCSSNVTITLPSSPSSGDVVKISSVSNANNISILSLEDTIEGQYGFQIDTDHSSVELIYDGSSWLISEIIN